MVANLALSIVALGIVAGLAMAILGVDAPRGPGGADICIGEPSAAFNRLSKI